jgi:hypothetical protein
MKEVGNLYEKYEFPPYLIFNMDETMVDVGGSKLKVITRVKSPMMLCKPNHMGNGVQPAVAPSDKVGKKKEIPQKIT